MANPNGVKGASFERQTADYWRDNHQHPAAQFIDRRVKVGAKDVGDLANVRVGEHKLVVECKNVRANQLSTWLLEAQKEAVNDGSLVGMVVHKRQKYGQPGDQYVTLTQADFLKILALIPPNTLPTQ